MRPLSPAPAGGGVIGDPSARILGRRHRYFQVYGNTDPLQEGRRFFGLLQDSPGACWDGKSPSASDGTGLGGGGGATGNGGRVGHVENKLAAPNQQG